MQKKRVRGTNFERELPDGFEERQSFDVAGRPADLGYQHVRLRLLGDLAEARGCVVLTENIKVRTKDTKYRYPDVVITCETITDEYMVLEPCALFEVLSESTAETDATAKLEEYLKLPSLQRYVMLQQNERSAIVYKRGPDGWQVEFLEANGEVSIPCLETTLKLEQVYAGLV